MALPLKKTIAIAIITIAAILAALLTLGVRQTQLARSQAEITAQAEQTLFQFSIIREHLHELLLAGQYDKLAGVAVEFEQLHTNLAQLLNRKEVAEEYRLGFMNSLDLPGTILLMRKIAENTAGAEGIRQLNGEMRALNERLLLFDRMLANSAKTRLIGFQNIVIGMLAVLLSVLVGLLVWLRRRMVVPLAQIGAGATRALEQSGPLAPLPAGCREIEHLAGALAELFQQRQEMETAAKECHRMAVTMQRASQTMARANDRHQLFREVCRALLHNPEYCLVWIGEPDEDGKGIQPAAADGSTTMSRKECESCLTVLLTEAEEKGEERNPALLAMHRRQPVVVRDILAGIPRGLLKDTPLADRDAACIALPIAWHGRLHGVISIYALSGERFAERELAQLEVLATALGCAAATLTAQETGGGGDASRLAMLGEIATGVAHEISDLSNGMINYAQALADEAAEGSAQADMLGHIITAGEHVSAMVSTLVFYGEAGQPEEYRPLLDVLRDAVMLGGYHLRKAGVQITVNVPEELPALPINAHQIQQVFMEIFHHARRALNLRYPGRHENKRFRIEAQMSHDNEQELLRLAFTDHGLGTESRHLDQVVEPHEVGGIEEGLNRCREVVARHGGTMTVSSVPGESTTIVLEFPVP